MLVVVVLPDEVTVVVTVTVTVLADWVTVRVTVVVETDVTVVVNNTLDVSVYDMRVELIPIGNMVRDNNVSVSNGYFDASSRKISWEISSMSSLEQVKSGESRDFKFRVDPDSNQATLKKR